jgi:outer membrane protein, protease secretion system
MGMLQSTAFEANRLVRSRIAHCVCISLLMASHHSASACEAVKLNTDGMPQSASSVGVAISQQARETSRANITLAELVQTSLSRQSRLQFAEASVRAAQAQTRMAQAQLLPNLSLSVSRLKNDLDSTSLNFLGQPVTSKDRYSSNNQTLTLRQPLYRPAASAAVRSAKLQELASAQQREVELVASVIRLSEAYFDHLLAQSQLHFAGEQVRARTELLAIAEQAVRAGNGTATERADAKAKLAQAIAEQTDARAYLSIAQQQLDLYSDTANRFTPKAVGCGAVAALAPAPQTDVQYWIDKAVAASPELAQLRHRRDAAREEIERAKAGHKPTLDFLVQRSRSGNENVTRINSSYSNNSFGIQFNAPLYSGGYVSEQTALATAEFDKASHALDSAQSELSTRVMKDYRARVEAAARRHATADALSSAREALRAAKMGVMAGIRSKADLAAAELQIAAAEFEGQRSLLAFLLAKLRVDLLASGNEREAMAMIAATGDWFGR